MSQAHPQITVYFLQASRSIRTVWLLEELGLPYQLEFANRENQRAPQDLKDKSGNPLGKFPSIKDKDLVVHESGAITEYICDHYDPQHRMVPQDTTLRSRTQTFIHAAEGTFMLHSLAILYFRWQVPQSVKDAAPEGIAETEEKLGVNVCKDMDWLELELGNSTGRFLVGDSLTAADIMVLFSVQFITARELGVRGKTWPKITEWVQRCEGTESYKRAVQKSGHTLYPEQT